MSTNNQNSNKLLIWGIVAFVLGILVVIFFPLTSVGAGERGVVLTWGAFKGETLQPGLNLLIPISQSVVKMDVQTQKEQDQAAAASSDLQNVDTTVAVNWNVDPNKVGDLYVRVGTDFASKIIDPAIQEVVKAVTANYTAEELISKRNQVTTDIQNQLTTRLATNDIIVTNVSIVNFGFSQSFNDAVEAKVTSEQNALAAKNKLDQVQYEADQRVAEATGEAKAIQIQAQAINSQGGADYVALQAISKWDGKLPDQMIPGQTLPFINITAPTK